MESEAANDDDTVSYRDRLEAFVESVDDVPGVYARVNGFGPDAVYATVNVDHDYGNRDEFGNGNVAVARDSEDPVGREAFDRDLRIVRGVPQPDADRTKYWFAHADQYGDATIDGAITALITTAANPGKRQAVVDVAVDAFGEDVVDRCLRATGYDPDRYGADADSRGQVVVDRADE